MGIRKRTWTTPSGEKREAWVVDYADQVRSEKTGRLKRILKTFDRKKDAEAWAADTHVEIRRGRHTPASRTITVQEAGDLWIKGCTDLEPSTVEQYEQHLNLHIAPYIGAIKLSALTPETITAWQNRLRNEGRSVSMVGKVRTSLSSLIGAAMTMGKVGHNVIQGMAGRKKSARVEKRHKQKLIVGRDIPRPEEIDALLQHERSERWRAFLLVAIRCGLRSSELRGLRWEDVDLKKSELRVAQRADKWGKIGSPKSADSQRSVPIPPATLAALKVWKLKCPKDAEDRLWLVFPNGQGNVELHGNIVNRALQPAWVRAGVTVPTLDADGKPTRDEKGRPIFEAKYSGLHNLRHFFVSWCLAPRPPIGQGQGLSLKEASELAGHSSIRITADVYGHLIERPDRQKELAAAEGAHG